LKSLEFIYIRVFRGSPNLYAVGHCRSDDLFVNEMRSLLLRERG